MAVKQYKIYLKTKNGKRVQGFTVFREDLTLSQAIKHVVEVRK